jgi:hypothetical protein
MEKGDIDIRQLNTMVSKKVLLPFGVFNWIRVTFRSSLNRSNYTRVSGNGHKISSILYTAFVAIILLLMWPAALSAPLLSGSVDWIEQSLDNTAFLQEPDGTNISLSAWASYLIQDPACNPIGTNRFGSDAKDAAVSNYHETRLEGSPCFIAAKINFQVGVMRNTVGNLTGKYLVSTKRHENLERDRWLGQALYLLPHILADSELEGGQSTFSHMYRVDLSTLNDRIKYVVQMAFILAHNQLSKEFDRRNLLVDPIAANSCDLSVLGPEGCPISLAKIKFRNTIWAVKATVNPMKVYLWSATNLLFYGIRDPPFHTTGNQYTTGCYRSRRCRHHDGCFDVTGRGRCESTAVEEYVICDQARCFRR